MASPDNWDGFYPEHGCKRCGKPLQGQDTGYPAELYAGTYTGLCYACTSEPPYEDNRCMASGARVWSHPPSCPSHRRDREIFFGFDDCSCNHGRRTVVRSDGMGGSYGKQCPDCWEDHRSHPLVQAHEYTQKLRLWRHVLVTERANLWYDEVKDGKSEDEQRDIAKALIAIIVDCVDNNKTPPEAWPALKAPQRKKLLKRAPEGLKDADLVTTMVFMAGNPRRKRKTK